MYFSHGSRRLTLGRKMRGKEQPARSGVLSGGAGQGGTSNSKVTSLRDRSRYFLESSPGREQYALFQDKEKKGVRSRRPSAVKIAGVDQKMSLQGEGPY